MARIAQRIMAKVLKAPVWERKVIDFSSHLDNKQNTDDLIKSVKGVMELIEKGYDPLHALYVTTQNLVSVIVEVVSTFPELTPFAKIAGEAQDKYMPSGPPFSPLTNSHFTCWAFFDLQFGSHRETIGSCIKEWEPVLGLGEMREVVQAMACSRMGIYEHCGHQGSLVLLRDLVDDKMYACHVGSRYQGRESQLWLVRLMPPLPGIDDHFVAFTTPYVLLDTKSEWANFINRAVQKVTRKGPRTLNESKELLFKYGLRVNYWNNFILNAYRGHEHQAIYLEGIPDQPERFPNPF